MSFHVDRFPVVRALFNGPILFPDMPNAYPIIYITSMLITDVKITQMIHINKICFVNFQGN